MGNGYLLPVEVTEASSIESFIHTGATSSIMAAKHVPEGEIEYALSVGIRIGDGRICLTEGKYKGTVILGRRRLPKSFLVLETDAFDAVLGEDFFEENPEIPYLGLQSPRHLLVRTDDGEWEKVHLEETAEIVEGVKVLRDISCDLDTEVKVEGLLGLEKEMLLTLETYTLATEMKLHAYEELNIEGDPCGDDFIKFFANHVNADSELYCWRQGNSAWWYCWRDLGRWKYLYANPPFSQMEKVLTKVALEGARVILVVPEEGKRMKKAWRELLTKLTITQVRLPDVPMYKVDYGVELLPAPKWRTNLCLVDGSLNPVAREDLNPEVVEKITKNNRGWGRKHMLQHFPDLKESQQDRKREDMKVTIKELPKGNRELPAEEKSELSEEVHDSDGLSEAPSISTITPVTEGSYPTSMEYEDMFNDVLLACENEELLFRRTIEENLEPKSEWHGFQYGFETKKPKTNLAKPTELRPMSKQDREEVKALLWTRIDQIQKEELKDLWKSKVYLPDHDDGAADEYSEDLNYTDLCDLLEEYRETTDYYADEELNTGGTKRCKKNKRQRKKECTKRCERALGLTEVGIPEEVKPDGLHNQKKDEFGRSNLQASEDFMSKVEEHDERVWNILHKYQEVFGPSPSPGTCKKLVELDLELKEEHAKDRIRSKPYPCSKADMDEIMRQVLECVEAALIEEYKEGDYPKHCSPCFLVAKPGSTAKRLVVDYQKLNHKIKQHSGSLPFMENTVENAADCKFKTNMDKTSGFWQVDLTERAKDMMAFITPQGRIFKWRVMPFGISNAPALFQEMMSQVLCLVKKRPAVQELLTRGAVLEAHIDDVLLGTNSVEEYLVLLSEFFEVCQEQHLRIKLEKCEFLRSEMEYLGFTIGTGWWKPTDAKLRPLLDFDLSEVNGKAEGVKKIRQFVGSCNFYRRHLTNFTFSSAPLTDLIKNETKWQWTEKEQAALEEMKGKLKNCLILGVPRPVGEMLLVTDASDVGGGGTLFQWLRLNSKLCQEVDQKLRTLGVNRDGTL